MPRLAFSALLVIVGCMLVAVVARAQDWSPFAIALVGAGLGAAGTVIFATIATGTTPESAAKRLGGTGLYDFSRRYEDTTGAERQNLVERAGDILDELGL